MDAKRFPHVAFDSSIARIPRPGEAIDFYTTNKQESQSTTQKETYN